ncbi:MAG: hypothetical protein ACK55Z_33625, partial [bacterium]
MRAVLVNDWEYNAHVWGCPSRDVNKSSSGMSVKTWVGVPGGIRAFGSTSRQPSSSSCFCVLYSY